MTRQSCAWQIHTDTRLRSRDSLFTHAKFPVLCYSKLLSSPAGWLPTVSDLSLLPLQCTPGWDPQWPLASAECPRLELDDRHLKIIQMHPE